MALRDASPRKRDCEVRCPRPSLLFWRPASLPLAQASASLATPAKRLASISTGQFQEASARSATTVIITVTQVLSNSPPSMSNLRFQSGSYELFAQTPIEIVKEITLEPAKS